MLPRVYRRRKWAYDVDTWHSSRNCSSWPTSDYHEQASKPTTGVFCAYCSRKEVGNTPQKKSGSGKLRTLESLSVEIEAYEAAIAAAESQGRGSLPQVEQLRSTLLDMRARLQLLKQAAKGE